MKKYFIVGLLVSVENYLSSSDKFIWIEAGGAYDMTGPNQDCWAGNSVAISSDGTMVIVGEEGYPGSPYFNGRVRAFNLINGSWTQTGNSINGNVFDFAGWSVAVSADGKTLAIGEISWPEQNSNGRVRVYNLIDGAWVATGGASDMEGQNLGDFAGSSVAISSDGRTVAVGEKGWSGVILPDGSYGETRGRVRVYNLINFSTGSSWIQTGGDMDMTGQNVGDGAGNSIALSSDGRTVAMGESGWNFTGGRVRVFNLINFSTGSSWIQTGGDITGQNKNDAAGYSVSISSDGTTVAMGEPGWELGLNVGRVRAFNLVNGSWVPVGNAWDNALDMVGSNFEDFAGYSIAMSSDGKIIAMGEYGWPGLTFNGLTPQVGFNSRVRVFNLNGNSWVEIGDSSVMNGQNGLAAYNGLAVAISSDGKTVTMGEAGWPYGQSNGRVRVFNLVPKSCVFTGLDWNQVGGIKGLDMAGQNQNDQAGSSVAISSDGTTVAVGEPGWSGINSSDSPFFGQSCGRVKIYRLVSGSLVSDSWSGIGEIDGQNQNDKAGSSVALSSDGTTVAMGEPSWVSEDGIDNGRVRVFNLINDSWVATGGDMDITGLFNCKAGKSVAISSDGTTVAMGEPGWRLGSDEGRVRVYNLINFLTGSSWVATGGDRDMVGQTEGDVAGSSVAINSDGTTVTMGEPGWNGGTGRVRVYNLINFLTGSSWVATGGDMAGQNLGDHAGSSVAMSSDGRTVAMGESGWSGGTGRVRAFNLINGSWVETGGALDMTGQNHGDQAGTSVSISSEGTTVTMGEPNWSGGTGRVRAFNLINGSNWIATGTALAIIGQNTGDHAGSNVVISSDGKIVMIGEPGFKLGASNGRARTFNFSEVCYSTTGNITPEKTNDSAAKLLKSFQETNSSAATLPGGLSNLQLPLSTLYLAALQKYPNF